MRLLLLALLVFWLGLGVVTGPDRAHAAPDISVQKIAAVVNDGVVSEYDLEQRLSLAISTMGVPDTPRTRQQLRGRVLDSLIDELLQVQEAREKEVEIGDEEIESTIESLSRQNDLSINEFSDMLLKNGITLQTLASQVTADLMWRKLVRGSFLPRVSDEEVERIIAQREASKGKPEYQLSEIVITVDKAEERPEALKESNRLLEQMRRGANFGVVARQFSDGSTSANGGDMGWVQPDQLSDELAEELLNLNVGEVSLPIFSGGAYYILVLHEKRTILGPDLTLTQLHLKQIFFDLPEDASEERQQEVRDLANIVRETIENCDDLETLVGDGGASRTVDLGRMVLGELPPQVRAVVTDLKVGVPSEGIRTPAEVLQMIVCDRSAPPDQAPSKDTIAQRLHEKRVAMMARRYLRDLRRDAIIDVR